MPSSPLFAIAFDKIGRAKAEMERLHASLGTFEQKGLDDVWSRTTAPTPAWKT